MIRYTFTVQERLKREQNIKTLFQTGKAFSLFPLKIIWLQLPRGEEISPVRIAISVPKKRIKLAVDRNYIKRLVREAWRLNKHLLYSEISDLHQYHLFFIYTGKQKTNFQEVEKSLMGAIEVLRKQIKSTENA